MHSKNKAKASIWIEIGLILILAALSYLPNITHQTFYHDDWYYIMDGHTAGPAVFHAMFSIDRPARGYLFEAIFSLFGTNPLPYHILAFGWRFMSGLAALWLFRLLWPTQRRATFFMALLFTLYPGYLWWVSGVEYQPMIMSACLQALSFALTLKAICERRLGAKIAWLVSSILTGWAYIALVDYAIGMELFRLLAVFLLVKRQGSRRPFINRSAAAARAWSIYAIIPAGFLFWHLFLFQNIRRETDIGAQLGALTGSPLFTGAWWLIHLIQSWLNVALLAWGMPFATHFWGLRLKELGLGLALGLAAVGAAATAAVWLNRQPANETSSGVLDQAAGGWAGEAIWMGCLSILGGVLPVVMANRTVVFDRFSHYALPASLGAAVLCVGLVGFIASRRLQTVAFTVITAAAVLTHYGVAAQVVNEEQKIQQFWWQMAWRASGLKAGATLLVDYPDVEYTEDQEVVWGPANLIYFPDERSLAPIKYKLAALSRIPNTVVDVLGGGDRDWGYRTHAALLDYENLLVISQPAETSCVHVLDGTQPRLSISDRERILLLGERSKINNVLIGGKQPDLPVKIFGREPEHAWCYYYQKAEAALQLQQWDEIISLGRQAAEKGLHPVDRVEWMPFLQAYAVQGDTGQIQAIATKITGERFLRVEACRTLTTLSAAGVKLSEDTAAEIQSLFCYDQKPQ